MYLALTVKSEAFLAAEVPAKSPLKAHTGSF